MLRHGQPVVVCVPDHGPRGEGQQRARDDDGDEEAGDLVRKLLDGRLARLRLLNQADDLRERRVLPHVGGLDQEEVVLVDAPADDEAALELVHGHGLAGDEALVAGGLAEEDLAIDGDLGAGDDLEDVVAVDEVYGDRALREDGEVGVDFDEGGLRGLEAHQLGEGVRGFGL